MQFVFSLRMETAVLLCSPSRVSGGGAGSAPANKYPVKRLVQLPPPTNHPSVSSLLAPVSAENNLLTINWHLEKDCNYKCIFCYAHFKHVKEFLGKDRGFELLRKLWDAGVYKVNFAGGEPLLNQHLGDYLKYAKELGLKTSIITNVCFFLRLRELHYPYMHCNATGGEDDRKMAARLRTVY